jgi:hypothetical protein
MMEISILRFAHLWEPRWIRTHHLTPSPCISETGTARSHSHHFKRLLQMEPTAKQCSWAIQPETARLTSSCESQSVLLTNNGNTALNLTQIVAAANPGADGNFAQTNNCGSSVGPSKPCTINVTFSPSAVGNSSGTLTLTDNAANSPQVVVLSGSAADFSIEAASGSSTTATISGGQTATYNLQIQGNQLSSIVGLSCLNAPPYAACTLSSTNVSVAGIAPVPFQVLISTTGGSGVFPFEDDKRIGGRLTLALVFSSALLLLATWFRARRSLLRDCLAFCTLIAVLAAIWGCGGGGGSATVGSSGTPAGTYTLTVTGQSENGTRSINLTLIVQ